MPRSITILLLIAFVLAACAGPSPEITEVIDAEPPQQMEEQVGTEEAQQKEAEQPLFERPEDVFSMDDLAEISLPGHPLPVQETALFTGSGNCTNCHQQMTDAAGNDVSIDVMWRGSMMANSARDPYFRAAMRREVDDLPEYREFIEDKCATCHMPIARTSVVSEDGATAVFDQGFYHPDNYLNSLAMDGVSCTVCHQIQPDNFGQDGSFSGHYLIDTGRPAGTRYVFGPYSVTERRAAIMSGVSKFIPKQSPHVDQAELCATCHTLFTPSIDENDEIVGEFPEQVPYLEWLHSEYRETHACQDCHMPPAEGGVILSTTGGETREPFFKHLFIGANTYILRILRKHGEELNVAASSQDFQLKVESTMGQLEQNSAEVAISNLEWQEQTLEVTVDLTSKVGHKLPSAFPSRRVWIRLVVTDEDGSVIFESGDYRQDGRINQNDNDLDPDSFEPHYQVITGPEQVQIYEPILGSTEGEVTTFLLRANGYIKDNRLLPMGFDKDTAGEAIRVHGRAVEDPSFQGGGDQVLYRLALENVSGPITVDVEILMQSIGYRWADNHRDEAAQESEDFIEYYDQTPNMPVLLARDSAQINPEE